MDHDPKQAFWKALSLSPFLMVKLNASSDHSIPMTSVLDDDLGPVHGGAIWFFTTRDNRLAAGGPAMAQFISRGHDLFACVAGTLVEETDSRVINQLWSSVVEGWYDQGRADPSLLVLRMELADMEVWVPNMGIHGMLKLMASGKVDPGQAGQHVREAV